jgi:hypothetical protein
MSDHLLLDGDMAVFQPTFGAAVVIGSPGRMTGSGRATVRKRAICVAGDETRLSVPGCVYTTPQYSIPGVGTLKISGLGSDQQAQRTTVQKKAALLVGNRFRAIFEVQTPAQQPNPPGPPVPDAMPSYSGGVGMFVSTNLVVKGT